MCFYWTDTGNTKGNQNSLSKKKVKDVDMTINELGLNYSKCIFIKLPDVLLSQLNAIKFYTITALLN